MNMRSMECFRAVALLLIAALTPSCGSTAKQGDPAETSPNAVAAAVPGPALWTREFEASSTLIAREVILEGPPGLVDHVILRQSPDQNYTAKATPDGFLQEITINNDSGEMIRIQIDNLSIAAERHVRVFERIVDGPVLVRATGDVYWKNLETGQEVRMEAFELIGARPR